jgi:hypothetical protein
MPVPIPSYLIIEKGKRLRKSNNSNIPREEYAPKDFIIDNSEGIGIHVSPFTNPNVWAIKI